MTPARSHAAAVSASPRGAVVRLRVIPRAKVTALDGMYAGAVRLRVAAPPADGKANAAVLSCLAGVLGVRRQDLTLVRGAKGRDKAVEVAGLDVAEVLRRLASADPAAEEG
jgi:uncharacterized protein